MKVMHSQGDDKPRLYPNLSGIEDGQEEYCEPTPLYPLVEVANPHYDPHQPLTPDNNRVMRVYRPWTESNLQEACKGLGKPTEDPGRWTDNHRQLASYGLNGWEVQRTLMPSLGFQWERVKGNFTGKDQQGQWLPADSPVLQASTVGVYDRMKEAWKTRPDYGKVSQGRQNHNESVEAYRGRLEEVFQRHGGLPEDPNPDSPYQQQLKMAYLQGLRSEISQFVRK